jgi:hypothetical protein
MVERPPTRPATAGLISDKGSTRKPTAAAARRCRRPADDPCDPACWRTDRLHLLGKRLSFAQARRWGWVIIKRAAKHIYCTHIGRCLIVTVARAVADPPGPSQVTE